MPSNSTVPTAPIKSDNLEPLDLRNQTNEVLSELKRKSAIRIRRTYSAEDHYDPSGQTKCRPLGATLRIQEENALLKK